MDPVIISVISVVLNAVLGLTTYMMKQAHSDMKKSNEELWDEIDAIKEKYFRKEDFSEFKQELWKRFDRLEDDVKARIEELKK
jgi:hypothetical protein